MKNFFQRFVSVFFHPLFMPLYGAALIIYFNRYLSYSVTLQNKIAIAVIFVVDTIILPMLIAYFLNLKKIILSYEMETRAEREIPYFATAFCYLLAYYLLEYLRFPKMFQLLLLGAVIAIVIATVINVKWKISIHMIGAGGITGLLFALSQNIMSDLRMAILIAVLFSGIIGTVRLAGGSHHPAEIYSGFMLGFFCEYLVFSF